MIRKLLKDIARMIQADNFNPGHSDIQVTGVSIDTRKITEGNLFVPFKGEKADGHEFVETAIKSGASAALWQKDVPNPPENLPLIIVEDTLAALQKLAKSYRDELNLKVIGITGSNGKTTTKDITANLLALKYKVHKTGGNYNNHIGLPLTILELEEDTEVAVLEMGMSKRGEIEFLSKLARPDAVIITNIGESHLLDLGSREAIAEAKLEIIKGLKENGLIIYHGDEPLLQNQLISYSGGQRIKTFGKGRENDCFPIKIEQGTSGSVFMINGSNQLFKLPVLGAHNIMNAMAGMLVARDFGISFEEMNEGFASLKLTNMRMEMVEGAKGEKIINDAYNASPTSVKAAIDLVANLPGYSKKILVLGDMLELGPLEEEFHYQIGADLDAAKIDYVFTFGELAEFIAKGAQTSLSENRVRSFSDKKSLISELKKQTDKGTLVLVKASRGMRLEEAVHSLQK